MRHKLTPERIASYLVLNDAERHLLTRLSDVFRPATIEWIDKEKLLKQTKTAIGKLRQSMKGAKYVRKPSTHR